MSATTPVAQRCPDCGAAIEKVTFRGGRQVERCSKCGREPHTAPPASNGAERKPLVGSPGSVCRAEGCPGHIDASGACPCCVKRAAWAAEHTPKRFCEICGGEIQRTRNLKFCKACKVVTARARVAKSVEKSEKADRS